MKFLQKPFFLKEIIKLFAPLKNKNFIDATIGEGGHSEKLLELNAPNGKVLGIDLDEEILRKAKMRLKRFKNRIILVSGNYAELGSIVKLYKFPEPDGILFDLGFSMFHIKEAKRGFSFQEVEPLDMRYSKKYQSLTAKDIVNNLSLNELVKIFRNYGDVKNPVKVARGIIAYRKQKQIETTKDLKEATKNYVLKTKKISPFTTLFQALRIAVNLEFQNLEKGLSEAIKILKQKGKLIVITFHSGEEKIVKKTFYQFIKKGLGINLFKKPIISKNHKAKLFAFLKITKENAL